MGLNITGNRMVFHICLVLMLIFLMMSQTAIAKNVGITIQYTGTEKDINPATYPLTKEITGKLDISENTNNVVAIGKALNELQDGDILVLAVHSNPEVFGIGKETDRNWAEFWKTFDVKNPPKLGVVVILGCMKGENDAPATPEQQEAIRKTFNADALFAPQKAINPLFPGLYQVNMIVDDVKNGKELSEINPGRMWNCVTAPGVNKNEYTWPPQKPQKSFVGNSGSNGRVDALTGTYRVSFELPSNKEPTIKIPEPIKGGDSTIYGLTANTGGWNVRIIITKYNEVKGSERRSLKGLIAGDTTELLIDGQPALIGIDGGEAYYWLDDSTKVQITIGSTDKTGVAQIIRSFHAQKA